MIFHHVTMSHRLPPQLLVAFLNFPPFSPEIAEALFSCLMDPERAVRWAAMKAQPERKGHPPHREKTPNKIQ